MPNNRPDYSPGVPPQRYWSDAMVAPFGIVDGAGQPKAAYWEFRGGAGVVPSAADVIVTGVRTSPEHPVTGEVVQLFARVKNLGAATTGSHVGVAFFVDGQYFSWGAEGTLASGQELEGYASVGTWVATEGTHTLTATADDVNRFSEADETNNSASRTVQISAVSSPVEKPSLVKACFSVFTVTGDEAPTLRADLEVQVPAWAWCRSRPRGRKIALAASE